MGDLFQRWPTIGHLNFGMVPMAVFAGRFCKQAAFQSIFELHGERVKYTTAYSISCLPLVVTPVALMVIDRCRRGSCGVPGICPDPDLTPL